MAVQSITSGISSKIKKVDTSHQQLEGIIEAVYHYLFNFGHNWFYLAIGKSYYLKCSRSWVRVTTHIEKFLRAPRENYTLLMLVLDLELQKFSPNSYYGKHLKALKDFFRRGPHFNSTRQ